MSIKRLGSAGAELLMQLLKDKFDDLDAAKLESTDLQEISEDLLEQLWEQYVGAAGSGGSGGSGGSPSTPGEVIVPNITIGTVTTLAPGSQATVTRRTGSPDSAPIFDFGIPAGATPVKGVDYWTAADKQSLIADLLEELPNGDEVSY